MTSKQNLAINQVLDTCIQCNICVKECDFLTEQGDPFTLATMFRKKNNTEIVFSCSLCGLCTAVCPKDVDPAKLFLRCRQHTVAHTDIQYKEHKPLRAYEKMGSSKWLSWYGLPTRCDTIFFPGCALPGTRSKRILEVIHKLQPIIPQIGVLLDCCTKPSHDLGDHDFFRRKFARLQHFIDKNRIKTILVACPNCYRMFKEYGKNITVKTIYEVLPPCPENKPQPITIHDPCGVRFHPEIHTAVRTLLARSNGDITEMKHHGEKTLCCGEGGAVGFLHPKLATSWTKKRSAEANHQKVITYCAGCTHFLSQQMNASHLLDFLFEPEQTMAGKEKIATSPFTYWHRYRLKGKLQKQLTLGKEGHLNQP